MSITDDLRRWARRHRSLFMVEEELNDIAVRIDVEYQKAIRELNNLADASMLLPLGADGVPIHVGDKLTDDECTFTVCELAVYGDGSWSIRNEDGNAWAACDVTHCKPDSWERIIEDALIVGWQNGNWNEVASADIHDRLVERCRRLAGEAE